MWNTHTDIEWNNKHNKLYLFELRIVMNSFLKYILQKLKKTGK